MTDYTHDLDGIKQELTGMNARLDDIHNAIWGLKNPGKEQEGILKILQEIREALGSEGGEDEDIRGGSGG